MKETRYLYASRLNTRKSNVVCNEIINIMKPLLPKSITMDRGKEFALFEQIEDELNCSIYFSDLGCPYQRGSIENANGLLRQYYPKGTDFANITQKSLDEAVKQINARPRMIFDYKSSDESIKYVTHLNDIDGLDIYQKVNHNCYVLIEPFNFFRFNDIKR